MCEKCHKTYVEGFIQGLNLDQSSDFTKAINEIANYTSSLSCKIEKLERKLDILQANMCNLECCLDSNCCSSNCCSDNCCCCDESSCLCPDTCSCKVKCKCCGTVNHVSGHCNCGCNDDLLDCCKSSGNNSSCCQ